MAFNMTGWPAAVVRCGESVEGLPIGVQIAAGPWREDIVLAVARRLEELLGGGRRQHYEEGVAPLIPVRRRRRESHGGAGVGL